jgi:hypothetical protein
LTEVAERPKLTQAEVEAKLATLPLYALKAVKADGAGMVEQFADPAGQDAGHLGLGTGIYLDQHENRFAGTNARRRKGVGQLRPVQAFNYVGQPDRLARLVGLQRADDVQAQFGPGGAQGREFPRRLLHPVLPEGTLPGGQGRGDRLRRVGLGDGDEGDRPGRAVGAGGGLGDPVEDAGKIGGDV